MLVGRGYDSPSMSRRLVYFNGEFVSEGEARVSIFDSALMFGDMVFEMTRTFNHKPFKLREHLDRLYASMRLLEFDCGVSIDEMERLTLQSLERNITTEAQDVDWQIMHDVSRGPLEPYRSVFPQGLRPTVVIACWPLIVHMKSIAPCYDAGVHLVIAAQRALPADLVDPKAKTRSRQHYRMAELQGKRMGEGRWPIMLDPDGYLAEGPGWNLFLVKDGSLYTPEPRNILLGVSRSTVIELADQLGIAVHERNLGRYEALTADEMFATSTPFCMLPGRTFEGQPIGDGKPGPVFNRLISAWKDTVGLDFVAQAKRCAQRGG